MRRCSTSAEDADREESETEPRGGRGDGVSLRARCRSQNPYSKNSRRAAGTTWLQQIQDRPPDTARQSATAWGRPVWRQVHTREDRSPRPKSLTINPAQGAAALRDLCVQRNSANASEYARNGKTEGSDRSQDCGHAHSQGSIAPMDWFVPGRDCSATRRLPSIRKTPPSSL